MPPLSGRSVVQSLFSTLVGVVEAANQGTDGTAWTRWAGQVLGSELEARWRDPDPTSDDDTVAYARLADRLLQDVAPGSRLIGGDASCFRFLIPTNTPPTPTPSAREELLAAALGSIAGRCFGVARVDLEPGLHDRRPVWLMTVSYQPDLEEQPASRLFRRADPERLDARSPRRGPDANAAAASRAAHHMEIAEAAVSAAHGLSNLLGTIAHESSQLLAPSSASDRERGLRAVRRAADDGAIIVRRLLRLSRGDLTEGAVDVEPVDLNAIIRDALARTRLRWDPTTAGRADAVELQLELTATAPAWGVPADLREVVANLVDNAVDAMPDGGTLTLRTRARDDRVVLECRDTGIGMPDEVRQRVFEPFFTTKGAAGSGMGLAIVHRIVARLGGDVRVHSEPGVGTTVTISLPAAETPLRDADAGTSRSSALPAADESASVVPPSTRGIPRGLRVLLVDDDAAFRSTFARWLAVDGHEVTPVENGRAALRALGTTTWDAVLVDEHLPDISGRELARRVRAEAPDTFVVLVTGFATGVDDTAYLEPWLDAVLPKPARDDELERILGAATARRDAR